MTGVGEALDRADPPRGFLDRHRAARLLDGVGLDGMVLIQPESIRWAAGADPGLAASWRRAGAALLLVPADPGVPPAAVVGDLQAAAFQAASGIADVRTHPIWVDTAAVDDLPPMLAGPDRMPAVLPRDVERRRTARPATFDARAALRHLADCLAERGLLSARLGIEQAFLPVADAPLFADACPGVSWADVSPIVGRLRMIKHPREIEMLDLGGRAAEAGVRALARSAVPGVETAALVGTFREAALAEAARLGADPDAVTVWAYLAVGPDGFAPGGPARDGDVVKVDVGCVVGGYSSDSARTFGMGEPSAPARAVHAALLAAFEAGRERLRPGVPLGEIHEAMIGTMRRAGFPGYGRGHFGHGLGASIWSEEWPFIGAGEELALEPGMVMALEAPWYVRGLGGFIVEDQFTIPAEGPPRALWSLPHDLLSLPADLP